MNERDKLHCFDGIGLVVLAAIFVSSMSATLNVGRLTKLVIFILVLPVTSAIIADLLLSTLPWITIIVAILMIPVASIVVIRASLDEFDKVIQEVAPVDSDAYTQTLTEETNSNTK